MKIENGIDVPVIVDVIRLVILYGDGLVNSLNFLFELLGRLLRVWLHPLYNLVAKLLKFFGVHLVYTVFLFLLFLTLLTEFEVRSYCWEVTNRRLWLYAWVTWGPLQPSFIGLLVIVQLRLLLSKRLHIGQKAHLQFLAHFPVRATLHVLVVLLLFESHIAQEFALLQHGLVPEEGMLDQEYSALISHRLCRAGRLLPDYPAFVEAFAVVDPWLQVTADFLHCLCPGLGQCARDCVLVRGPAFEVYIFMISWVRTHCWKQLHLIFHKVLNIVAWFPWVCFKPAVPRITCFPGIADRFERMGSVLLAILGLLVRFLFIQINLWPPIGIKRQVPLTLNNEPSFGLLVFAINAYLAICLVLPLLWEFELIIIDYLVWSLEESLLLLRSLNLHLHFHSLLLEHQLLLEVVKVIDGCYSALSLELFNFARASGYVPLHWVLLFLLRWKSEF